MFTFIFETIKKLESESRIDVKFIIAFLVFVSLARMLLEILVGSTDIIVIYSLSNYLTLFYFYSLALLSYTLFISLILSEKPIKIARILTPFLIVALLVPVIDYLISGYPIVYQMSSISNFDILRISSNNPLGESIILWLIPFMSFFYLFFKGRSIKKSIIGFFVVFLVPAILSTSIPDFIGLARGLYYLYASTASVLLLLILFYLQDYEKFGKLFMRFQERFNRVFLYIIIFVFGIAISGSIFTVNFLGIYILMLIIISFIAMCTNDYFDFLIDKANRKDNILNTLAKKEVKNVVLISFLALIPFLTFIFESLKNVMFVCYMISIISLLFLYSYRNFIKSVFLVNYLTDALSYSIVLMAGRSLLITTSYSELVYFTMATIIFFLIIPVKDIKDFKGDKKFGIKNLYTIIGFKKAFKITKVLLSAAFVIFSLCFVYILPYKKTLDILIFYFIPSVIIIPFVIILFKRNENVEMSIWLIDLLILVYLVPFLL